jgi:hypothetical protein
METLATTLSESLVNELVTAVGLTPTRFNHWLFWRLFRRITDQMAVLGARSDAITQSEGFPAACQWLLTHFCADVQVHGAENIPDTGPLLVLSNHPGTYDALVIFSTLQGHEIRSVSSEIPFLELLPNIHQQFLFTPRENPTERMLVLRHSIQHLQKGGTLNFFGSGHRDPDPVVYPNADLIFENWLNVFDVFFRTVQGLKVLPAIVSGVTSPKWAKHPITWLRKNQIDKRRLAEFGQVITQLRKPGKLMMRPRIFIGKPFSEEDLRREVGFVSLNESVIARARGLYRESSAFFGDFL